MRAGIIGGGRAAHAFGRSFARLGWTLEGVTLRAGSQSRISAELSVPEKPLREVAEASDVLLIAASDRALEELARACAAHARPEAFLLHASGAHAGTIFGRARSFALHPLRSLQHEDDLRDTFFVFDGDAESEAFARAMVERLGGTMTRIDPEMKSKYHAAAVFASNFVAVLLETSERLMRSAGVEVEPRHLAALASSAVANWTKNDSAARFTGPIVRGDADVIRLHMNALTEATGDEELYVQLSRALIDALVRHGADASQLEHLQRTLERRNVS